MGRGEEAVAGAFQRRWHLPGSGAGREGGEKDLACVAPGGLCDGHVAAGSFSWGRALVGPARVVAVVP